MARATQPAVPSRALRPPFFPNGTRPVYPPPVSASGVPVSGVIGTPVPAGLVHGMGKELVEPDWSPLTSTEVRTALARYPQPGSGPCSRPPRPEMITWRSPRPMSAAALVRRGGVDLFVKRHHVRVRTPAQLAVEHAFIGHLRARAIPAPAVLRTAGGATATQYGDFVYEVHEVANGLDLYRDAVSWTPYTSLGHARAAGAALARLHLAADRFPLPARSPAVLTSGCELIVAADPLAELKWLAGRRPGLAAYLDGRAWPDDLTRLRAARHPAGRAAAGRTAPAVGSRRLAPVQPDLDVGGPGRGDGRGVRLRAGQPDLRRARPGQRPGAGHRVLARPDRPGPGRGRPGRHRRAAGRLRVRPPAHRSRSRRAARGVPRGARRVRAVRGRVLRPRGQLARQRRPGLRRLPARPRRLVRDQRRRRRPRPPPPPRHHRHGGPGPL